MLCHSESTYIPYRILIVGRFGEIRADILLPSIGAIVTGKFFSEVNGAPSFAHVSRSTVTGVWLENGTEPREKSNPPVSGCPLPFVGEPERISDPLKGCIVVDVVTTPINGTPGQVEVTSTPFVNSRTPTPTQLPTPIIFTATETPNATLTYTPTFSITLTKTPTVEMEISCLSNLPHSLRLQQFRA